MFDAREGRTPDIRVVPVEKLGKRFWLPVIWIAFVMTMAICADLMALPHYGAMDWQHPAAPPGTTGRVVLPEDGSQTSRTEFTYWLGTDTLGRDMVTRLIYGARVSLAVGLIAPAIALALGGTLGILAGFYGGWIDAAVVTLMDIMLAFPGLVLLLAVALYFGTGLDKLIPVLSILATPAFCRVARANTLTWSRREFILAARAVGAGDARIICCHLLPNVVIPLASYGLMIVAVMIIAEGAMSFLGLGIPAPMPSWGGMIAEGKEVLNLSPHVSLIPAAVMFLTVLSFNLLGDRLRALADVH